MYEIFRAGICIECPLKNMHVYIYIYIYIYTHTHTHIHIYTHVCIKALCFTQALQPQQCLSYIPSIHRRYTQHTHTHTFSFG
jgi:hypothetical protein